MVKCKEICIICYICHVCKFCYIIHIIHFKNYNSPLSSFRGRHDCLVPVTPYLAGVFNHLRIHHKLPPRVRAIDMRHILLLLPFLLDRLLTDVVLEHNRAHPLNPIYDPSSQLIGITLLFIRWFHLYRRRYPPKDEVDIQTLDTLGRK